MRDFLNILFRHQRNIVLFFVSVVSVVTIMTFLSPEIYQSDTRVLIQVGRESVSVDPAVVGPTISVSQSRENEINSELALLNSRFLAEKVIDKISVKRVLDLPDEETDGRSLAKIVAGIWRKIWSTGGANAEPNMKADSSVLLTRNIAIKKVIDNLEVATEKKSNIINMSFQAQNPELAQDVLKNLLDSYLEHHIEVHRSQASPRFFQEQSAKLLNELTAKEEQLEQFRRKHNISSIERQTEELLASISRLQNEMTDTRTQISSSKAKITSLGNILDRYSRRIELSRTTGRSNPAADTVKDRLIDLRLKEADLAARYPDDARILTDLRRQIKLAEVALAKEKENNTEVTTGIDANYQELQRALEMERAQLQANIAREITLNQEAVKREDELNRLSGYKTTLNRLQRDVDILKNDYLKYSDNFQRAKISAALDMDKVSNVSIVQPPTLPFEPVKPKKALNVALGVFLGVFGGFGLAFVSEFLDDSFKTAEDVKKRLGLPVLATVSEEEFESCT